jgi:hypothetical protein
LLPGAKIEAVDEQTIAPDVELVDVEPIGLRLLRSLIARTRRARSEAEDDESACATALKFSYEAEIWAPRMFWFRSTPLIRSSDTAGPIALVSSRKRRRSRS